MGASIHDQLEPALDLRVVLVGRTGLESTLRKDARVELTRVERSLEAIGELGMPIDEESPERCVVVLGVDPLQGADLNALTTALKRVDDSVRVVGVGHWDGMNNVRVGTSAEIGLDAWVRSDIGGDQLRALFASNGSAEGGNGALGMGEGEELALGDDEAPELGEIGIASPERDYEDGDDESEEIGLAPEAENQPEPESERPLESGESSAGRVADGAPEAARVEPKPAEGGPSPSMRGGSLSTWTALEASEDIQILEAMLAGNDVLPACMARLRRRLAPNHVEFHAAPGVGELAPPAVGEGETTTEVGYKGRVFGWLSGPAGLGKDLGVLGDWLAHSLALHDQRTQLRMAAFTDPLTGAWNRRYFDGFITTALEQARDRRNSLTLLLFDVDDFKTYNDRFGHEAGDQILRQTVRLMRSVIRPTDRVCRVGGDEFAVIFYEPEGPREQGSSHPNTLLGVVNRFQEQIARAKFPALGDQAPGSLTISGGLATFPWDGLSASDLIRRADALVLESKRQGKNQISIGMSRRG